SAALALALALAGARARAEEADTGDVDAYRDGVARGTAAFRDGRFDDARAEFEHAYEIHPEPILLFDIASCWRRAGESEEAVKAYQHFLAVAADDDPRRALAEHTIEALAAPAPAALPLPPSRPAPAPAPDAEPPHDNTFMRRTGLVVTAFGVIGLVAGGVQLARADAVVIPDAMSGASGHGNHQTEWNNDDAIAAAQQEQSALEDQALVFGVTGAVVAAAGLTLYLTHRHDDDATMQLGAVPTRDGGQLVLTGRF
ncbi:MAG TPA: hypothetical protein VL463_15415, partial [Kofleriaceae bacterium]|nr:hypothetical protein [Kofleriaceae bacterium]